MLKTFRHGTHPNSNKHTTDMPLTDFAVPESLFVSVSQHIGAPAKPIVEVGDAVKQGQMIAEASSFVSAHVFSPVSGTVKRIIKMPTATGTLADHIEIENDFLYEKQFLEPIENPSQDDVKQRIKDAGIVGMGGATFPTHVKFSPSKPIDTFIVNGAECEPYITCDNRLLVERVDTVIKGIQYAMLALGVDKAYIGIENNKPEAIKILSNACPDNIFVVKLVAKYPQGAEKQLIYACSRKKVPNGGLPMDCGCVVSNVHTVYSLARAVDLGETLFERAMTVSGGGVEKIGNYMVKTGTTYQFIYDTLRGDISQDDTKKIISGGPMMGFAQSALNVATTKGSSSLLFLTEKQFNHAETTQCINCGKCINHCPMTLMPRDIERAVNNKDFQEAFDKNVLSCIECGVCAYACPAKRPLVQAMRLAKSEIRQRGIK